MKTERRRKRLPDFRKLRAVGRVSFPIFNRREVCELPEDFSEGIGVVVAGVKDNFINRLGRDLQLFFGVFYFDPLNIFSYRVAGTFAKSPFKSPAAHSYTVAYRLNRDP